VQQQNPSENAVEEVAAEDDPTGLLLCWYFLLIIHGFILFLLYFTLRILFANIYYFSVFGDIFDFPLNNQLMDLD